MLTIQLLGDVRNIDIAFDALGAFAVDAFNPGEIEQLCSRLPHNPNRNIFLWLLEVVLDISAPAFWWKQISQHTVEIFTMRRQDAKDKTERMLAASDFEGHISKEKIIILNNYIRDGQPETALRLLPANFIQRGYVKINYKTLNEIYCSKNTLTDEHWSSFIQFLETLPYRKLITDCH